MAEIAKAYRSRVAPDAQTDVSTDDDDDREADDPMEAEDQDRRRTPHSRGLIIWGTAISTTPSGLVCLIC
jgi:hypothetical protein